MHTAVQFNAYQVIALKSQKRIKPVAPVSPEAPVAPVKPARTPILRSAVGQARSACILKVRKIFKASPDK